MAAPFPIADADLCVKCGLCLPHCPTYGLTQHEGDSPRGRIALMQGLALGSIPATAKMESHLDGCLGCRSCESVCPAKVPYGRLIDAGRAALNERRPQRRQLPRLVGALLARREPRRALGLLLWLYQASGLQWLLRRLRLLGSGRLARLESLLPRLPSLPFSAGAAGVDGPADAALFTGCAGDLADTASLEAAQGLLRRLGLRVAIPPQQGCCGALYQHAGLMDEARACMRRNADAFAGYPAVLGTASGCAATLLDAPDLLGTPEGTALRTATQDIHGYLLRRWPQGLRPRPLRARVAVHEPCTQRNVTGGGKALRELLRLIPEMELVELDPRQACCGAAGSHFITHPEEADRLLQPKLEASRKLAVDYIVSSNIGCSLHLAAGLRRAGFREPEVLHPLTLLDRQLGPGEPPSAA